MKKLKAYKVLPCDNIGVISKKLFDSISAQIDIHAKNQPAWHFLDTIKILKDVPELVDFFKQYKLFPKHAAATVINEESDLPLHVDAEPVIAKINFPVLNTQGWINNWYTVEDSIWNQCPMTVDIFGNPKKDIAGIPNHKFVSYDSIEDMGLPVVFNSQIPHKITKTSNAAAPRIVASFTFINEPLSMLE